MKYKTVGHYYKMMVTLYTNTRYSSKSVKAFLLYSCLVFQRVTTTIRCYKNVSQLSNFFFKYANKLHKLDKQKKKIIIL